MRPGKGMIEEDNCGMIDYHKAMVTPSQQGKLKIQLYDFWLSPIVTMIMACFKRSIVLSALLFAFILLQWAVDDTYVHAEVGGVYRQFLPQVRRESCPPFLEDFSTTANGWFEGGIFVQEYGHTNHEYFLRLLAPGWVAGIPMPLPCNTESVTATVTGRWLDEAGAGFGIQFGPVLTPSLYYIFDVNPEAGTYRVLERIPSGVVTFIPDTPTTALDPATPTQLEVNVSDSIITLSANGVPLEAFDNLYKGPLKLGLTIATTPTQADLPIEARFDDIRVYVP